MRSETETTVGRSRISGANRQGRRNFSGRLFIVCAPSGAGKTTLTRMLLAELPDLRYSISYTTRKPRSGEREGVDYHFISPEDFHRKAAENGWAEWAKVHDHCYGTSADFLERCMNDGQDVLLDIDLQGAKQLMGRYPRCISVFIMPPSLAALESRLRARGTDSERAIQKRMKNAIAEIAQKDACRHVIVNDDLRKALGELVRIVSLYRSGGGHAA